MAMGPIFFRAAPMPFRTRITPCVSEERLVQLFRWEDALMMTGHQGLGRSW